MYNLPSDYYGNPYATPSMPPFNPVIGQLQNPPQAYSPTLAPTAPTTLPSMYPGGTQGGPLTTSFNPTLTSGANPPTSFPPMYPGGTPGGPLVAPFNPTSPNPTLNPTNVYPSGTPSPGDRLAPIVSGGGNPINQLPAWQAMIDAQQRQIQENATNLGELFNVGGNRFSTAFGTSLSDYYNQANLQQNALLGQMTAQAGESAQNRLLQASGQLSSQDFQSMMQQYGLSAQMAQQLQGQQYGAAGQLANLYQSNLGLGSQLGGQQYGFGQSAINNQYQNWLYQQPQNNPFTQYLQQLMTYYPSMVQPGYNPGALGGIASGLGSVGGGLLAAGVI